MLSPDLLRRLKKLLLMNQIILIIFFKQVSPFSECLIVSSARLVLVSLRLVTVVLLVLVRTKRSHTLVVMNRFDISRLFSVINFLCIHVAMMSLNPSFVMICSLRKRIAWTHSKRHINIRI